MNIFFNALLGSRGGIIRPPSSPNLNASTSDVVLVFDGDSLTLGQPTGGQYYPNQVRNHYSSIFQSTEFYSYGVGGQTLLEMMNDANSQIYPKAKEGKVNILVGWGDANSMGSKGNRTASQMMADYITYFQNAKNAGFDYCILINSYYQNLDTDTSNGQRAIFFDQLLALDLNTVPWDYHIDLRQDPIIGGERYYGKDPAYFTDNIHLTKAGYDIVAGYVIAEINKIFGL